MSIGMLILLVLIVLMLASIPAWPYSREWGYGPSGLVTALLIVLIVVMLARPDLLGNRASIDTTAPNIGAVPDPVPVPVPVPTPTPAPANPAPAR